MSEKKLNKKKIMAIIVIIGVIIIPLLYSYFYLGAFWDPYSKLTDMPVAIVNNDNGAIINGEERNLGKEMCDFLKSDSSLKYFFINENDAIKGTEGNLYYASIIIPSDFSTNIASVSTTEKKTAQIIFSPNEKRNYLASQILGKAITQIEEEMRGKIASEVTTELRAKLIEIPEQLNKLSDGLVELYNGSEKLKDGTIEVKEGAFKLSNGTDTFVNQLEKYKDGITSAKNGSKDLYAGVNKLDVGITTLLKGAEQLEESTSNINQLSTSTKKLAEGMEQYNKSINAYTDGVNTLINNINETSAFIKGYVIAHPELIQDPQFAGFIANLSNPENANNIAALTVATEDIKIASSQINQGISQLSNATEKLPKLKDGITSLKNGLKNAESGSKKIIAGSETLKAGMVTLSDATEKISDAANQIANGAGELYSGADKLSKGANDLNNGIETAKTSVNTSITDADNQTKSLNGLNDYMLAPVTIETKVIEAVPNYGTAFAPYFLCLSLWIGGLMIFFGIYLDTDEKFTMLSRSSNKKLLRTFAYLLIGLLQAVVLNLIVMWGLGLKVEHPILFFISSCLVSLVFISIIQFLLVCLKDIGKFLAIVLLILQLTSCGGTFPMETVPKFFDYLYPFMPMTYAISLFKESISSVDAMQVMPNIMVLSSIVIAFVGLTILFTRTKAKINKVLNTRVQTV